MNTVAALLIVAGIAVAAAMVTGHVQHPEHARHIARPVRDRLARIPHPRTGDAMTDDPQRSPDWCWTHQCHRNACPKPH